MCMASCYVGDAYWRQWSW